MRSPVASRFLRSNYCSSSLPITSSWFSCLQMAERPTPFQQEVQKMSRQMTIIVAVLAAVVALILLFVLHEPLVDVALNTLSLAVATIPESLPIVLPFSLALGARQMALRKAVVRRLSVVESLGSVDTICTDKTGTLTQNRMTVQKLYAGSQIWERFSSY
jgi:P-type Ca2+ transporter type 2C